MTKTTTNLLGILITILAGTYFFITCCSECGLEGEEAAAVKEEVTTPPAVPEASSYPFAFSDGSYSVNENGNFNFNTSSSNLLMPLAPGVAAGVTSLKGFLDENGNKVINITGYYTSDETNATAYPNLGYARAVAVKNHLKENGVNAAQINTMGKLMDDMVAKDNMYQGPIGYDLGDVSADAADQLKALYDKIKANPLVLHFQTGQASISLTPEQRQKIADISRYLDKVSDAKCMVTGHTDNEGSRTTNVRLGQERADFAKGYLMRNGISETKIVTASKGPDVPVATNATEEGRAENRRTVVTLN